MLSIHLPLRLAAQTRLTQIVISRPATLRRILLPVRTYATPAKPKKGSIGATAKRGRATKATSTESTAKKTTTTRKPAAKKPQAKKAPSASAVAKAAAAKKRAADRAEKSKAKKAEAEAKKRAKEKQRRDAAKAKASASTPSAKIIQLKKEALSPPAAPTWSSWMVYWQAALKQNPNSVKGKGALVSFLKEAQQDYAALSPSEKESYTRAANEERERRQKELSAWVKGKSAEEIRLANAARRKLKALKVRGYTEIKDDRQMKKPLSPYIRFASERSRSGEHAGPVTEQARESSRLWKSLSESQKQDYIDTYNRERSQFLREYEQLYGHAPPMAKASKAS